MTEQALLSRQQSNIEQAAPFPSTPEKIELTTDDVIFPSEDRVTTSPAEANAEPSYETLVENGLKSAELLFESSLNHKVKTELVAQFFDKKFIDEESLTTGAIDIARVSTIIQAELQAELVNNEHNAQYLENVEIPKANVRQADMHATEGPVVAKRLERDIDRLYARVDISNAISERISAKLSELQDVDSQIELAEEYIHRLKDEARAEAVAILLQQEKELERQQALIQERIRHLSEISNTPTQEATTPEPQPLEEYDESLVHHLTEKAKSFAHSVSSKIKIAQ